MTDITSCWYFIVTHQHQLAVVNISAAKLF